MRVVVLLALVSLAGCIGYEEIQPDLQAGLPTWQAGMDWTMNVTTSVSQTYADGDDSATVQFEEREQTRIKVLNTTALERPIVSVAFHDDQEDEDPWTRLASIAPGGGGLRYIHVDSFSGEVVEDEAMDPMPGLRFPLAIGTVWAEEIEAQGLVFDVRTEVLGTITKTVMGKPVTGLHIQSTAQGAMSEAQREEQMASEWRTLEHIDGWQSWTFESLYDLDRGLVVWTQMTGSGGFQERGTYEDGGSFDERITFEGEQVQTLVSFSPGDGVESALEDWEEPFCCNDYIFGRIDRTGTHALNAADPSTVSYALDTYGSTLDPNWTIAWEVLDPEGAVLATGSGATFQHTFDRPGVFGVGVRVAEGEATRIADLRTESVDYDIEVEVDCGSALPGLGGGACASFEFPVTRYTYHTLVDGFLSSSGPLLAGDMTVLDAAGNAQDVDPNGSNGWRSLVESGGYEEAPGIWVAQLELDQGLEVTGTYEVSVSSWIGEWPASWLAYR